MSSKCRTLNPDEADLFFVPALTKVKEVGREWMKACAQCTASELLPQLPHLNKRTAHKHMFLVPKQHVVATGCKGWWAYPTELFAPAIRLASTAPLQQRVAEDWDGQLSVYHRMKFENPESEKALYFDTAQFPNAHSVPQSTMVHWSRKFTGQPPWEATSRETLMLFIGTDSHGDVAVRQRIHHQCHAYNDPLVCRWEGVKTNPFRNAKNRTFSSTIAHKKRATFCLEPDGDCPDRRSIADSIAMGCIPVFFSQMMDSWYDLIWGDWRNATRILVPRGSFTRGEIDLKSLLTSIPQATVTAMQRQLREHASAFQVSLEDDPRDLVSNVLRGLVRTQTRD